MSLSDGFNFASVAELGAAFRAGRASPLEVTEAALERAAKLEPQLNATILLMREAALEAAKTATRELRDGLDRGPLHGIPVAIKDLIDIAGVPTSHATRAIAPKIPLSDASLVRNLRRAGAVMFAKTNLLEFAYGVAHPEVGQTNNPWDVGRTSGGSSGGSAALVSAGVATVAVGTDTGGSIRIPASYCGIVGLKPSFGLVSLDGVFPLSWSLDHAGPLARSVADAAALLSAMTGGNFASMMKPLAGLRIGLVGAHLNSPLVSPGVREIMGQLRDSLAFAGALLQPVEIPELESVNRSLVTVLHPEASLAHEGIFKSFPGGYAPGTRAQIEAGFQTIAIDYVRAQRLRLRLMASVQSLFANFDVLLSPSVSFVAPSEDPLIEGDEGDGEMLSSGLANMTGHPALSLPCGFSEGLPVGVQLMGPVGEDAALLSAAAAIEAHLGISRRPNLPV